MFLVEVHSDFYYEETRVMALSSDEQGASGLGVGGLNRTAKFQPLCFIHNFTYSASHGPKVQFFVQ